MNALRSILGCTALLLLTALLGLVAWDGFVQLAAACLNPSEGMVGREAGRLMWGAWGCASLGTYLVWRHFPNTLARCLLITEGVLLILLLEALVLALRDSSVQDSVRGVIVFGSHGLLALEALILVTLMVIRLERQAWRARRARAQGLLPPQEGGGPCGCEPLATAFFFPLLGLFLPFMLLLAAALALCLVVAVPLLECTLAVEALFPGSDILAGGAQGMTARWSSLLGGSSCLLALLAVLWDRRRKGRRLPRVVLWAAWGLAAAAALLGLAALGNAHLGGHGLPGHYLPLLAARYLLAALLLPLLARNKRQGAGKAAGAATGAEPPPAAPACTPTPEP